MNALKAEEFEPLKSTTVKELETCKNNFDTSLKNIKEK